MMPLIGLCPQTSEEGRPEANLRRIADCAREGKAQGLDLVLLGEAFLQGFDCLSLQMEAGLKVALWADDAMIQGIHETARQPGAGISFGFYEKALEDERPALCAACRVVDGGGCLLCHDRRRSPGWRTKDAPNYREGDRFLRFYLAGKTLAVMVCGDFWEEGLLKDFRPCRTARTHFSGRSIAMIRWRNGRSGSRQNTYNAACCCQNRCCSSTTCVLSRTGPRARFRLAARPDPKGLSAGQPGMLVADT